VPDARRNPLVKECGLCAEAGRSLVISAAGSCVVGRSGPSGPVEIVRTGIDGKGALTLRRAPMPQRHARSRRCYVTPRRAVEAFEGQAGNMSDSPSRLRWQDSRDRIPQVEILFAVPLQFREP
jgi:hypothetical protein